MGWHADRFLVFLLFLLALHEAYSEILGVLLPSRSRDEFQASCFNVDLLFAKHIRKFKTQQLLPGH